MTNSFERFVDALRDAGCYVEESGDRATAQAPGHSGADRSISVLYNHAEGRTAFMSFADEKEDVLATLGLTWADLFDDDQGARYEYGDGRTVHRSPDKRFRQSGNTHGSELFHADRLADADTVHLVEGEHDVLMLEQAGVVATCTAMGAGKAHLFDLTPLHGKRVIVVQDTDQAGAAHAAQIVELLGDKADVSIVKAKTGKDAADHITAGHSVDEFEPVESKGIAYAMLASALDAARGMDELADGLAHLRTALNRATPNDSLSGFHVMSDLIEQWWNWYEKPESNRIIPTPWPTLNEVLSGGFHTGRSYLIGGRPGGGKSLLLSNFAQHAAFYGHPGLLYSVEMGRMEVTSRILAAGGEADYKQVTARRMTADNLERITHYVERIQNAPLYISDQSALAMPQVVRDAGKFKADKGIDFIGLDYVQLLKSRGANRQEALSETSREIKILAGELDVAMVSACQLNRGNAKENRKPVLSDLRESGALEQDSDVVILLHQPTDINGDYTGDVELIVAKNRTGRANITVTLPWRPHYAKIG